MSPAMADRSHLSIGEVLSLLQDDFPDVTISKIRFLESQGLVDPERTASGYRKFYDDDVERLRWILRQQRENFLLALAQAVDVRPRFPGLRKIAHDLARNLHRHRRAAGVDLFDGLHEFGVRTVLQQITAGAGAQ